MNTLQAGHARTARTARGVLLAIFLSLAVLPSAAQAGPALPVAASRPASPTALTGTAGTAYVGDLSDNLVTPIDLATGTPLPAFDAGGLSPYQALTPDHKTLYLEDGGGNTVRPFDLASQTLGAKITVGSGPQQMAISPDGKTLFVVNRTDNPADIGRVNLATNTPEAPLTPASINSPDSLVVSPDSKTLYIIDCYGATLPGGKPTGSITPVDIATGAAQSQIKVGPCGAAAALTPDGKTLYVADSAYSYVNATSDVTPVNLATGTPGAPIADPFGPDAAVITPDGKTLWVANVANATVLPIDIATNAPGTPVPVGASPEGLAISPDAQTLYVTNAADNTVTPIDLATRTAGATIPTAGSVPIGITMVPPLPPALDIQVVTATQPVVSASDSQTSATVACPANTVLVGGGVHTYFATGDSVVTSTTFEPINGLVMRGTYPSDALGNTTTAANPPDWTALGGFAGQSESGDNVTAYAMCAARNLPTSPVTTTVVSTSINGPVTSATTASTTATCPAGDTLVGGGALMGPTGTPNSSASQKPVGSYPSDASGAAVSTNPNSWTAVGSSGGRTYTGNFTSAFALCASTSGPGYQTQVVRTDVNGPAGPGNDNPGSDPVATATATCPVGSTLVDGGALASNPAGLQQGVHVRGSYPSGPSGAPLTTRPASWSAIVQSGGQSTPGTLTSAFALCARAPAPPSVDLGVGIAGPASATAGSRVTYTVVATNHGPGSATGVMVTDTVSAGATIVSASATQQTAPCTNFTTGVVCPIGHLANGASATVTVVAATSAEGALTSTATVSGLQPDPNLANNTAFTTTTVNPGADLFLTKAGPATATVGTPYTYTLQVGNNGPSRASNLVVTDPLPTGVRYVSSTSNRGPGCVNTAGTVRCSFGALNAGLTGTFTITVNPTTPGSVTNTASIVAATADPNPANNSASVATLIAPVVATSADLAVSLTGPASAPVGAPVVFTVTATNLGPATATGITVTDSVSPGAVIDMPHCLVGTCPAVGPTAAWAIASLAPGASVAMTVTETAGSAGPFTNTATMTGSPADPNPANNTASVTTTATAPPPPGQGYWLHGTDGGVFAFGSAKFFGSTGAIVLNQPVVGMAATPDGQGYWLVASDGGIFNYGDAVFFGSAGSLSLNKPIVGMAATPDGKGYWLVASDGGIFTYGDAAFFGSAGGISLNKPIVGMAATPDGKGYWLVASDGGIFNYGDAGFFGSAGGITLTKAIVGMAATPDGKGYWLVASDGGIFTYGDAGFFGSAGGIHLNKPIVGMAATHDGKGYWLAATDGGVFNYGDAAFLGSLGSTPLSKPIGGITSTG